MKEKKRCIFHIPIYIDEKSRSGSSIRPYEMMKAFEANGYEVDCVVGYGKRRKDQIQKIKQKIKSGYKYDFVYAENSTMPTMLTEPDHVPRYPNLDFAFLRYCKHAGIRIGLFYRDVYWKFPIYKKEVSFYKRMISIPLYKHDLRAYQTFLDYLYLPSMKMKPYVDVGTHVHYKELPPGCNVRKVENKKMRNAEKLNLFYVGGVGEIYDLTKLFRVVKNLEFLELTVCCREKEWIERKEYYRLDLCSRIHITHESGSGLQSYYENADICMLFFNSEGYRSFAMPIKLFEYLGNKVPVIATADTAAGEFVKEHKIGWTINFEEEELQKKLMEIYTQPCLLEEMQVHIQKNVENNTWKARAGQVIKDLCE